MYMCVYIYIYIYICMHIYIYIYIYMYNNHTDNNDTIGEVMPDAQVPVECDMPAFTIPDEAYT